MINLNRDLRFCTSDDRRHRLIQIGPENGCCLPLTTKKRCRMNHSRFHTSCKKQVQQCERKPDWKCCLNVGGYAHDETHRKDRWPIPHPQRQAWDPNNRQGFPPRGRWSMCEWNLQMTTSNRTRRERNRGTSTCNAILVPGRGEMLYLSGENDEYPRQIPENPESPGQSADSLVFRFLS